MCVDFRLPELQYRNSMNLPHLRSTYMAQYGDQELREEDIKVSVSDKIINKNLIIDKKQKHKKTIDKVRQ